MNPKQTDQHLHYENFCGLLIRRDGLLSWRCPDCGRHGQSKHIINGCPVCGNKNLNATKSHSEST